MMSTPEGPQEYYDGVGWCYGTISIPGMMQLRLEHAGFPSRRSPNTARCAHPLLAAEVAKPRAAPTRRWNVGCRISAPCTAVAKATHAGAAAPVGPSTAARVTRAGVAAPSAAARARGNWRCRTAEALDPALHGRSSNRGASGTADNPGSQVSAALTHIAAFASGTFQRRSALPPSC